MNPTGCELSDWNFKSRYTFPSCSRKASLKNCIFYNLHTSSDGGAAYISQTSVDMVISEVLFSYCTTSGSYGSIFSHLKSCLVSYICNHYCQAGSSSHSSMLYTYDPYTNDYNDCNFSVTTRCPPTESTNSYYFRVENGFIRGQSNNISHCNIRASPGIWFESENSESRWTHFLLAHNSGDKIFYLSNNRDTNFKIANSNLIDNAQYNNGGTFIDNADPMVLDSCYFYGNTFSTFCSDKSKMTATKCAFYSNSFTNDVPGTKYVIKVPNVFVCIGASIDFTIKHDDFILFLLFLVAIFL